MSTEGNMPEYYGTLEQAAAYHEARNNAAWAEKADSPDSERAAALLRASAWLDGKYRPRFPGKKTSGRAQRREWPRTGAVDVEGAEIGDSEVPQEIIDATYEAALRELAQPGSLAPDFKPSEGVKRIRKKVGDLEKETEYRDVGDTAEAAQPVFTLIDDLLSGLFVVPTTSGTTSSFLSRA